MLMAVRPALPVVTVTIIAANVLVYLAMGLSGVSWTEPSIQDAVKWGADFGPLTLNSDWWRLFTSTFVHFGIIHIGLNMWCLWNLGTTLEPFMGRKVFSVTYVASGLAASLVSVAWDPWRVSAGASGAIFGVAGALVSYLALKKTTADRALVRRNLKSLGIFIVYNLLYGVGGSIDNSAHMGGLVAGLILGAAIPPMTGAPTETAPDYRYDPSGASLERAPEGESHAQRVALTVAIASAALLTFGYAAVRAKNIPTAHYGKAVNLAKAGHLDQAEGELQQAVNLDPNLSFGQALLGETLLEEQNPSAAIPALEQAAALFPNAYDVQHNLALGYLGAGRPSDALQWIGKALTGERNDPWRSLYVRGVAEQQTADYGGALRDLRAAIKAKPDLLEAQEALPELQSKYDEITRENNSLYNRPRSQDQSHSIPAPSEAAGNSKSEASALHPVAIPYGKLVMKSEYWPLYP
jgi:rhomboid protease GluP